MSLYINMSIPKAAIDSGGSARIWAIDLAVKGMSRNTRPTGSRIEAEVLANVVTLEHVVGVIQAGGSVDAWPCWLRMQAADLDSPVADGLPDRTDAQGAVRAWGQWHDPVLSSGPRLNLAGDEALVAANGFGIDPDGAAVALMNAAGLTVLSAAQAAALAAGPDWSAA